MYVLLPGSSGGRAEFREAGTFEVHASYTREEYEYESGPGEEEEGERWERDAKGKGKGKGKQRGEPPSKKMRVGVDEEGGRGPRRASSAAKGKGKEIDRESFLMSYLRSCDLRVPRPRSRKRKGHRI